MFKITAFGNTLAIIDLILHPLFHLWISIAPRSYEWAMNFFVAGLHLKVTDFDSIFLKKYLHFIDAKFPRPYGERGNVFAPSNYLPSVKRENIFVEVMFNRSTDIRHYILRKVPEWKPR